MLRKFSANINYIYSAALFLALHYAFTIYINSTFLNQYFPVRVVDLLYTGGSIGTLICLISLPSLIRKIGAYRLLLITIFAEVLALIGIFSSTDGLPIGLYFMVHQMLPPILIVILDVFLEGAIKTERVTGRIRSNYLTVMNIAFLFSPFIVGRIVDLSSYRFIYLLSGLFALILFFVVFFHFRYKVIHTFREVDFIDSVKKFHFKPGLTTVYLLNLLLHSFYALMVIYTSLHLLSIGFEWPTIGLIFTVMLVPFVLFEAPLGRIFDAHHNEQDAIIVGFVCMAVATGLMFMSTSTSAAVWAAFLFLSRTGASFVEIGTEYSFFKRVTERDAGFISVFRTTTPVAFVVASLFVGLGLGDSRPGSVFIIVSCIAVVGIFVAYSLNRLPRKTLSLK